MSKKTKNFGSNARETNVSTKVSADKTKTKVNGGVFTYTGAISAGELAKTLNIPLGEIIKFLFRFKLCLCKTFTHFSRFFGFNLF